MPIKGMENMAVSKKYIEELIQEREYDELKELLEQFLQDEKNKNNVDYRLFFNILRIIKQMQVISEAKYYGEPKVDYEQINTKKNFAFMAIVFVIIIGFIILLPTIIKVFFMFIVF